MRDTGTRNVIFMVLRVISESDSNAGRHLHVLHQLYKSLRQSETHRNIQILDILDLFGKELRLIRNLYWEQTACMRVGNDTCKYSKIKRGVRQDCVLSPDLFNLYSEQILRELNESNGFVIEGNNITNLRYADDAVLLSDSQEKLQTLLDKVVLESSKRGLTINCKKTECLVVSKRKEIPGCILKIGDNVIKQTHQFSYLGSRITKDGQCETEINKRIDMAKEAFERLGNVLKNRKLTNQIKKRVSNCYVMPILMFPSECWTITPPHYGRKVGSDRNMAFKTHDAYVFLGQSI